MSDSVEVDLQGSDLVQQRLPVGEFGAVEKDPLQCCALHVDAATRAAGYATERSGKTCFVAREDDDCAALVRGQSASPV